MLVNPEAGGLEFFLVGRPGESETAPRKDSKLCVPKT